jgi:hypothetical protein
MCDESENVGKVRLKEERKENRTENLPRCPVLNHVWKSGFSLILLLQLACSARVPGVISAAASSFSALPACNWLPILRTWRRKNTNPEADRAHRKINAAAVIVASDLHLFFRSRRTG